MKTIVVTRFAFAASVAVAFPQLQAAVLTTVPMQGSMVMPVLRFETEAGRLFVKVDPAIPQLVPLLVSHPSDTFDPADPWYDTLAPQRQGLAFSRRYGFVMDAATDPLPAGAVIWLRKVASSPGLEFYRYRSSPPKAWEPIFGTDSSARALEWDGLMFHPGVTAPPGTNQSSAVFEAVLADAGTGVEIAGSGSGPFKLNWTSVPDGRPAVTVALKVAISCPPSEQWELEASDSLMSGNWLLVTNAPVVLEGTPSVVLDPIQASRFYRMRQRE